MPERFMFHVRNAHPGDMVAVLTTIDAYPDLPTIGEVLSRAKAMGFVIRDRQRLEALMTARDLGLVEPDRNVITPLGKVISELELRNPDLFCDVIHYMQYSLWDSKHPDAHCFSWTYQHLCNLLWRSRTMPLTDRRDIAAELESRARSEFRRTDIALSAKSVGGALLWLAGLKPPVLNEAGNIFTRRHFCPPELFVLAVDYVYHINGIEYNTNLLLSEDKLEAICQVCLLEPDGFDRVLDYAVAQFDYLEKGMGGGWGNYLLLKRQPRLEDFL